MVFVVLVAVAQEPSTATARHSGRVLITLDLPNTPCDHPLTPKEKFGLFFKEARSPLVPGEALVTSASWQWGKNPPFGEGSIGFAEGFGAAIAQRESSLFISRFLVPTVFHQDPRYYPAREGSSKLHRTAYAISRVFMTRSDSGHETWNGSYIFGNLASAGMANLYIQNRDAGTIFTDFAIGMGSDAGFNVLKEFWPSLRKHVPGKKTKKLGDVVIGGSPPEGTPAKPPQK
jgi:hypothetical protein